MTKLEYMLWFIMFTSSINQWNYEFKLWDKFSYSFAMRSYIVPRKFLGYSDRSFIDRLEA